MLIYYVIVDKTVEEYSVSVIDDLSNLPDELVASVREFFFPLAWKG